MTEYLMDIATERGVADANDVRAESSNPLVSTTRPWTLLPDDLPECPNVDGLLAAVRARRKQCEAADRELAARRAFLERVWYSEHEDAVPLFLDSNVAFHCHPAGADRMAMTLSDQEAMACELASLAALERALVIYLCGGADTMVYFGLPLPDVKTAQRGVGAQQRGGCHASERLTPREYAMALERYAQAIERDLAETVTEDEVLHIHALEAELTEVRERLLAVGRAPGTARGAHSVGRQSA